MKKLITGSLIATAMLFSSCAIGITPVSGFLYTEVQGPLAATNATGTSRVGRATCQSILGAIARGDCSVSAAKKDGGITTVSSVDHKTTNILGLYAEVTTIVRGR